jgi:hypothetical protein
MAPVMAAATAVDTTATTVISLRIEKLAARFQPPKSRSPGWPFGGSRGVGRHLIVLLNHFTSCSHTPTTFSEIAPQLH